MSRKVYLDNRTKSEALEEFLDVLEAEGFFKTAVERIPTKLGLDRITVEAIHACHSTPHYRAAAMDGIAVKAESTYGVTETSPVHLRLGEDAEIVDTGDVVPDQFDAVIMIEEVDLVEPGVVRLIKPAFPWQHVRAIGEDMVKQEMLLPGSHQITAYDIGALLAGGVREIPVKVKPKIVIIPTGDELVEPGTTLEPGDIVEFNSAVMAGLAKQWHAEPIVYDPVPDQMKALEEALSSALDRGDLVVVNAGSSAGRDDYTSAIIERLGRVYTHGVAIRPGKPVILGVVNSKPVIGIPGYPVSSALTFEWFVKPLLYRKMGIFQPERQQQPVKITRPIYSPLGLEETVRVKIAKLADEFIALPLERGAGVMMSMVRADGFLTIPRLSEGIGEGQNSKASLVRSKETIENAFFLCGSHDLTLDVINDLYHDWYPGSSLSSSHVGSFGGITALKRKECHGAGMHLLDTKTGEYNIPFLEKHLNDLEVLLINLVYRQQGLLVQKGNPLGIASVDDIGTKKYRYINRQKGAGTRILFDALLKDAGLGPTAISGYQKEEYNHLAVAAAVAAGAADAGMGIRSAAQALDLDFVPLVEERYDLCILKETLSDERMKRFLTIIRSEEFKDRVERLGGYRTTETGRILWANCKMEGETT